MKKMCRVFPLLLIIISALCALTGCGSTSGTLPQAREMGDMALLRTMGVDLGENGLLAVTVSTGGEEAMVLSAEQPSLSAACLAMQGQSDKYVFFGYVDQLLLGEELAKLGIDGVLRYFAQDVELGLNTRLWVVQDAGAGEAMEDGQKTDSRLETLRADSLMGVALTTRTAGEILSDLLEEGSAYAPALDSGLREAGYAVFKNGKLKGILDRELSRGLELLAGETTADVLQFDTGGGKTVVRLSGIKSSVSLDGDRLHIRCTVQANLAESARTLEPDELDGLCRQLEQRERERIEQTLTQLQAWNVDCVGLCRRTGLKRPSQWAEQKQNWDTIFPGLAADIQVHAKIEGGVL